MISDFLTERITQKKKFRRCNYVGSAYVNSVT